MNRRLLLKASSLAAIGTLAAPMLNFGRTRLLASPSVELSTRSIDIVRGSTVIDMLGLLTLDWKKQSAWQRRPDLLEVSDFRQLRRSGIDVFHPAIEAGGLSAHDYARRWIAGWQRLLARQGCFLAPVKSTHDFDRWPRQRKIGVVVGFQNSNHFRTVNDVGPFFMLGQRVSQLTYNEANRLGSGCMVGRDRGLTSFGAEIVAEMNRIGMAVDLSHCGERTTLEAIAASQKPVLVTHSNCQALVPNQPRCKSDRVIRRLAAHGGVMGITVVRGFVGRWRPTVDDLLDHFEHVAKIVGVEHLGLGSDMDLQGKDPTTGRTLPFYVVRGLEPEVRVFQIAEGLLARGFSQEDVSLILGGNFRRALGRIWPALPAPRDSEREVRRDPFCPPP